MGVVSKFVGIARFAMAIVLLSLPCGAVWAGEQPVEARPRIKIVAKGGQQDVVGDKLYSDDRISVFEYRDPIFNRDACHNGSYNLAVIHDVPLKHVFSLSYLAEIYGLVQDNLADSECDAKYLSLRHYVKSVDLWQSNSYQVGPTPETSTLTLIGLPIIVTTEKRVSAQIHFMEYGYCLEGNCWKTPWLDLYSGPITAGKAQGELNPKLFANIEHINSNWVSNAEKARAQRELALARREANEVGAALLIIMALGGLIESSPCNDPERRQVTQGCE